MDLRNARALILETPGLATEANLRAVLEMLKWRHTGFGDPNVYVPCAALYALPSFIAVIPGFATETNLRAAFEMLKDNSATIRHAAKIASMEICGYIFQSAILGHHQSREQRAVILDCTGWAKGIEVSVMALPPQFLATAPLVLIVETQEEANLLIPCGAKVVVLETLRRDDINGAIQQAIGNLTDQQKQLGIEVRTTREPEEIDADTLGVSVEQLVIGSLGNILNLIGVTAQNTEVLKQVLETLEAALGLQ